MPLSPPNCSIPGSIPGSIHALKLPKSRTPEDLVSWHFTPLSEDREDAHKIFVNIFHGRQTKILDDLPILHDIPVPGSAMGLA